MILFAIFLIYKSRGLYYSPWIPVLFIILFMGSCIVYAISFRKRAQRATNKPPPPSQTDPPISLPPYS